jgi:dihydrofolate reductase
MGTTIAQFTMSLDGFIAGPNDDVGQLFGWYGSGDTDFKVPGGDMVFRISRVSAELLTDAWSKIGAQVTGRRDFDVSDAWGGKSLQGVPMFIVTHTPPPEWTRPGSPFIFVADGVASAVAQAQAAAGDKVVGVGGTKIVQQCLQAGLLDEIHIDLVPLLLGAGIRLFDNLGATPIALEQTLAVEAAGVTHLRYRVVR